MFYVQSCKIIIRPNIGTYKGVLKLDEVHCHVVLIFKKGPMEVDSSIEALDLKLQRGATFSIREEVSSFC